MRTTPQIYAGKCPAIFDFLTKEEEILVNVRLKQHLSQTESKRRQTFEVRRSGDGISGVPKSTLYNSTVQGTRFRMQQYVIRTHTNKQNSSSHMHVVHIPTPNTFSTAVAINYFTFVQLTILYARGANVWWYAGVRCRVKIDQTRKPKVIRPDYWNLARIGVPILSRIISILLCFDSR